MSDTPSIDCIDDNVLCSHVLHATLRVLYMAPGVSYALAKALFTTAKRLGVGAVEIILDFDAEIYRLGYGTLDGLRVLEEGESSGALQLYNQPGVRIGLLIADGRTMVYAPTPQLIEAPPSSQERPNGIMLGSVPLGLARDMGLPGELALERRVGLDHITPVQLEVVKNELERNPPARFDLARQVRVYSNYFQFVELELVNCYISQRRVRLPSHLIGLGADPELESRVQAQFALLKGIPLQVLAGDKRISEASLRAKRDLIVKEFLISLSGYGQLLAKERKEAFTAAVAGLCDDVTAFMHGVTKQIGEQIIYFTEELVKAFWPAIQRNPPTQYLKYGGYDSQEAELKRQLTLDIQQLLETAVRVANKMEVRVVYKEIAYESLQDEKFQAALKKTRLDLDRLFREGDAVEADRSNLTT